MKKLTPPNSENDIKNHWKYIDKVYISCICITYNQELYIKDTIDGFLSQKTEYKFEIIIHDDCSTDNTKKILLEYKKKYPSIIKLILQNENQYSKGKRILQIPVKIAHGEYICLCEGDDFWIDEYKIQKQIKKLIENKNINICFTNAYKLYRDHTVENNKLIYKEKIFSIDDVILNGGGFMTTATLMLKKDIFNNIPYWIDKVPVGDYFYQILGSIPNGVLYIQDITSVYRINSIGSWSNTRLNVPVKKIYNECYSYEKYLNILKEYPSINKDIIDHAISKQLLTLAIISIKSGHCEIVENIISKSWSYKKRINKKQIIIYIMRKRIKTLYFLFKVLKKIK